MRKIIFSIASLISVGAGVYFSFFVKEPNYAMTGIWLTFSLFTFAFGWPEIAKSISFLGNNIELREVKNAINELKQLAEVASRAILEIFQGAGRWGGFSEEEFQATYTSVEKMLVSLDFKPKEIADIQSRWHYWVEGDYARAIIFAFNINHPEIPKEKLEEWHKKREELLERVNSLQPDDFRVTFRNFDAYTPAVQLAIDDFEYYKKNKKHKDVERWKRHHEWFSSK